MFVLLVRYKCKQGCRDRYYEAIRENHIDELSLAEEGCMLNLSPVHFAGVRIL